MAKKKVLFLYNGGTIGQIPQKLNGGIVLSPPKDDKDFRSAVDPIIAKFNEHHNIETDFELVTTKDSTNMTPNDWEKLIFRIKKAQDEQNYDAVGIAHGTDTLAYTATALALGLHGKNESRTGLRIPVCVTGAQNPVYEPGGDGRFNLENLFRTIEKSVEIGAADVMINFWDQVLLGARSLKTSEKKFFAFKSPAYPSVGVIDATGVNLNSKLIKMAKDSEQKFSIAPKFGKGVLSLELTPGLDPNLVLGFVTNGGVSAMILKSLGEGNVCTEGEFNLIPVIKQISTDYLTPIFITTKFVGGNASSAHYEVGLKAIQAGGIACYDHTDVAVDVKVRWLLGNGICSGVEGFRKAMGTNYAGEVTQE